MPTTVTASNGNVYHLWQLPDLSSPEPASSISFTTLDNDLADGYRSTRLFGSNTGVRKWKLNLPTLAGSTIAMPTVTDINGASVSREEYVWSLYTENKVTGTPFAYTDPRTGQYYLVDFEDDELSFQRMRVKLYSTGLTLRQRRLSGVTLFSVGASAQYVARFRSHVDWTDGVSWNSDLLGTDFQAMIPTGNVDDTGTQNGFATLQLNVGATNTGLLQGDDNAFVLKEAFLVMKMREATFSNNCGVLTKTATSAVLVGTSGGTKFQNLSLGADFAYRKNGTLYAANDQQAPMNEWGIVHVRIASGSFFTGTVQLGKDRATAATFAEMDIGEAIFSNTLIPAMVGREITEYLTVKWGIV